MRKLLLLITAALVAWVYLNNQRDAASQRTSSQPVRPIEPLAQPESEDGGSPADPIDLRAAAIVERMRVQLAQDQQALDDEERGVA